jgi:uncharacterized protein
MNLWIIFLTGLTTGGLSCLAVQGGLLASIIALQKNTEARAQQTSAWLSVVFFMGAKLGVHILLGFLLGLLGSFVAPTLSVQLLFQFLTGVFMLVIALNLLDVHPFFRRFTLQPPAFIQRYIRRQSKNGSLVAPVVLGILTVFLPCGVTQAMEAVAIVSGNPVQGAAIMGVFVLGTAPLFIGIGMATATFAKKWKEHFLKVAAYALIGMAAISINGVLVVLDSPVTVQKVTRPLTYFFSNERFAETSAVENVAGVQKVTITVSNNGYSPSYIRVKSGMPVELTLITKETYSCAVAFRLPEFGIATFLEPTSSKQFTFTPTKPGKYTFSCSMGMYTGVLEVI